MREVTVESSALLASLKENRGQHEKEFRRLKHVYVDTVKGILTKALEELGVGDMPVLTIPEQPRSHLREYDQAIRMVEMSTDTKITLSNREFAEFVMDEWDWKQQFDLMKTAYGV